MRIVTPYGRSRTELRRVLSLKPQLVEQREIAEFARSDDRIVIAQWVSAIDKIATKPKSDGKPTREQRALRERLGKACWKLIGEKNLLGGNLPEGIDAAALWKSKVHPYKDGDYQPKKASKPPRVEGRWYKRFAGDVAPEKADVEAIAASIHEHLYGAEYRISPDAKHPTKQKGKIAARAESIETNVLKPRARPARGRNDSGWTEDDECHYAAKGDVAAEIHSAARKLISAKKTVHRSLAGEKLHAQYRLLFGDVPIKQAAQQQGLFALHMAVKECYARLLKGHGRKPDLRALPEDATALFELIGKQHRNRDLNHLIRLGKIIHYEFARGADDSTATVLTNWPQDVPQSRYWTSDGQAEIKRNEAFVRVWRRVLALMQRTATDWADPEGQQDKDILSDSVINAVTGDDFPRDSFDARLDLLFGSRADLFKPLDPEDLEPRKAVLKAALDGLAELRNGAFHFKGLGDFAKPLEGLGTVDGTVKEAIGELWNTDRNGRAARLGATFVGAHADRFLDKGRAEKLLGALAGAASAALPLPRFNRVIKQAENTWTGEKSLSLPKSVNRPEIEASPALHCQYICLKLLYERPFRNWLETAEPETLNGFIDKAYGRSTEEAREINAKNKPDEEKALIRSRASTLGRLGKRSDGTDETLADFFFRLSAATATEMRVQRGYESDAEQAKKQAMHIENLKCELLALAFDAWLKRQGYGFLTGLDTKAVPAAHALWAVEDLALPAVPTDDAEPWQRHLYVLLHLAPVGAVSSLLHQMRKWNLLAGPAPTADKTRAVRIMAVLELWLDMHDAKFEGGGTAIPGVPDDFRALFERGEDFDSVFATVTGSPDDDRRIPVRGLREIRRFGHMKPLMDIFEKHRVTREEIEAHRRDEKPGDDGKSKIAKCQQGREQLHKKWVDKKISNDEIKRYKIILQNVTAHRHRAARVLLTDHARLHDLMMAVLGRLVDYAGLFERDLYFTTLALMHEAGLSPTNVFKPGTTDAEGKYRDGGLDLIEQGRALEAVKRGNLTDNGKNILKGIELRFNLAETRGLRNRFAHFNMLRGNEPIDLTDEVNKARALMAYDRKLKNAVAKSIKELLAREGLDLCWTMGDDHALRNARIASRTATHLGDKSIREALHGAGFVAMAAALFAGQAVAAADSTGKKPASRAGGKGPSRRR